jgi:hypothetical protein
MASFSKNYGVEARTVAAHQRRKRYQHPAIGSSITVRINGIEIGGWDCTNHAEQEKNDTDESTDSTHDGAPKDTPGCSHGRILGLFRTVPRCIETNKNTRSC